MPKMITITDGISRKQPSCCGRSLIPFPTFRLRRDILYIAIFLRKEGPNIPDIFLAPNCQSEPNQQNETCHVENKIFLSHFIL